MCVREAVCVSLVHLFRAQWTRYYRITCVYPATRIQLECMLCSGGHVCGRRNGWGQTESSARECLVSGALQEMKNENESVCVCGVGVRGALVIGGGCHF